MASPLFVTDEPNWSPPVCHTVAQSLANGDERFLRVSSNIREYLSESVSSFVRLQTVIVTGVHDFATAVAVASWTATARSSS